MKQCFCVCFSSDFSAVLLTERTSSVCIQSCSSDVNTQCKMHSGGYSWLNNVKVLQNEPKTGARRRKKKKKKKKKKKVFPKAERRSI